MRAQAKKRLTALLLMLAAVLMSLLPMGNMRVSAEEGAPQYGYLNPGDFSEELNQEFLNRHTGTNLTVLSNDAPAITVLTHGLNSDSSHWSNDGEENKKFRYNTNSLLEKLRIAANDANMYHYTFTRTEEAVAATSQLSSLSLTQSDSGATAFAEQEIEHLTDVSRHSVVVFNASDYAKGNRHDEVYHEFHQMMDKLSEDYLMITGTLPKFNLIGHSRGGITNLQYAIGHPYNIASFYTLGTPYLGSATGAVPALLGVVGMNPEAPGLVDIQDTGLQSRLKEGWAEAFRLNPTIEAHALTGMTSIGLVDGILKDPEWGSYPAIQSSKGTLQNLVNVAESCPNFTRLTLSVVDGLASVLNFFGVQNLEDLGIPADADLTDIQDLIRSIYVLNGMLTMADDLLVSMDSGLAKGFTYQAVEGGPELETFTRRVKIYDSNSVNPMSESYVPGSAVPNNPPVPHNLEPWDPDFHNYIINTISFGSYQPTAHSAAFTGNDATVSYEDLTYLNRLDLTVQRSGAYRCVSSDTREFSVRIEQLSEIPAYEGESGMRYEQVFDYIGVLNGEGVSYEFQTGESYRVYLAPLASGDTAYTVQMKFDPGELESGNPVLLEGGEEIYFKLTVPENGLYRFSRLTNLPFYVYNDLFQDVQRGNDPEGSRYLLSGGATYYLYLKNTGNAAVTERVTVSEAESLSILDYISQPLGMMENAYFRFTPEYSGTYLFEIRGTNFSATLLNESFATYTGCLHERISATLEAGKNYYLRISSSLYQTSFTFRLTFEPQQVYLGENVVSRENGIILVKYQPRVKGNYTFTLPAGYEKIKVLNESLEMLTEQGVDKYGLLAGDTYYLLIEGPSSSDRAALTIGLEVPEMTLNQPTMLVAGYQELKYARFTPVQSGRYTFHTSANGRVFAMSLYDEALNLLYHGTPAQLSAQLEEGRSYVIELLAQLSVTVEVRFDPTNIEVNQSLYMMNTRWYRFVPEHTDGYILYTYSDGVVPASIKLYSESLELISSTTSESRLNAALIDGVTYFILIEPVTDAYPFIFSIEYADPSSYTEEASIAIEEGVAQSPYMVSEGIKVYKFIPDRTAKYQLRIMKNFANPIVCRIASGNSAFSQLAEDGQISTARIKLYEERQLVAGQTYYFSVYSGHYDVPTILIVENYTEISIASLTTDNTEAGNGYLYPNNVYQVLIRGTGARGREVIGYDKEFDIMSDNGLLPPAEIDADGNLRVYHDAQIGARVIVRVKCGFLEYAVIYEVQYPVSFSSQIDSDMTFRILYDNLGEVQYDPTSTIEWIAYTVTASDGAILLQTTVTSAASFFSLGFHDLNFYDNIKITAVIHILFNGQSIEEEVSAGYSYQTTGTISSFSASGKTRLVFDLSQYSTTSTRTISIPSNITVLNLKGNGTQIQGLRFVFDDNCKVNLYNINLKANAPYYVFNSSYASAILTVDVRGTCRISGGDASSSYSATPAIHIANIKFYVHGVLNIFGGDGSNGSNGSNGSVGADGETISAACVDGNPGSNGTRGYAGANGKAGAIGVRANSLYIYGNGTLNIYGGNGGDGGNGGNGGMGGRGSDGGGAGFFNQAGTGGRGGNGGYGGIGGAGGAGGIPYGAYNTSSTVVYDSLTCLVNLYIGNCGKGGTGGTGGKGGTGGRGGSNTAIGYAGYGGDGGTGGNGGAAGNAYRVTFTDYKGTVYTKSGITGVRGMYGYGGTRGEPGDKNQTEKYGQTGAAGSYGNYGDVLNA